MNQPSRGSQAGIGDKQGTDSSSLEGIRGRKRDCRRTRPGKVREGFLEEGAFALGINV